MQNSDRCRTFEVSFFLPFVHLESLIWKYSRSPPIHISTTLFVFVLEFLQTRISIVSRKDGISRRRRRNGRKGRNGFNDGRRKPSPGDLRPRDIWDITFGWHCRCSVCQNEEQRVDGCPVTALSQRSITDARTSGVPVRCIFSIIISRRLCSSWIFLANILPRRCVDRFRR